MKDREMTKESLKNLMMERQKNPIKSKEPERNTNDTEK